MTAESGPKPALLVSACLLGVCCNHRGQASSSDAVAALASTHHLVGLCPETAGGLPTPRPAAEIQSDGRVRTESGDDVSDAYRRGAEAAVSLAKALGATRAVLKARSPSCGNREVYDGTFQRRLRPGEGITAAALRAAGVDVVSEEDVPSGMLVDPGA